MSAVSLVPGTILAAGIAGESRADALFYRRPEGRKFLRAQRQILRMAEDPKVRILTDSGLLQLYQKERAPFVDPFQFRMLVETGQVRPDVILRRIRDESFDLVITTTDLDRPEYRRNIVGLPEVVAQAAREHYVLAGRRLGLFLYAPRRGLRDRAAEPGPPSR
jgi:hypothetical protein